MGTLKDYTLYISFFIYKYVHNFKKNCLIKRGAYSKAVLKFENVG